MDVWLLGARDSLSDKQINLALTSTRRTDIEPALHYLIHYISAQRFALGEKIFVNPRAYNIGMFLKPMIVIAPILYACDYLLKRSDHTR